MVREQSCPGLPLLLRIVSKYLVEGTISSPLEAHKNAAIIHHIVGLDVGFENPMFAALEVDYTESDQDPTGEAFNNAEKVCRAFECELVSEVDGSADADIL